MTLDKEEHRQLLLNCLSSAQVSGPIVEVERVVAAVAEIRRAVEGASVLPPLAGEDTHS
jgi:hypothetical protein